MCTTKVVEDLKHRAGVVATCQWEPSELGGEIVEFRVRSPWDKYRLAIVCKCMTGQAAWAEAQVGFFFFFWFVFVFKYFRQQIKILIMDSWNLTRCKINGNKLSIWLITAKVRKQRKETLNREGKASNPLDHSNTITDFSLETMEDRRQWNINSKIKKAIKKKPPVNQEVYPYPIFLRNTKIL